MIETGRGSVSAAIMFGGHDVLPEVARVGAGSTGRVEGSAGRGGLVVSPVRRARAG